MDTPIIVRSRLALFLILCGIAFLSSLWIWPPSVQAGSPSSETQKTRLWSQALTGLDSDHLATSDFSSHLPLVIFAPSPGAEGKGGRFQGQLKVVAGPGPVNRPDDRPSAILSVTLVALGDQPVPEVKTRFEVRPDGFGPAALLGLPTGDLWLLEGSAVDPAMLRNYLAYTLGREIMDGRAPRTRFCEVFFESGTGRLLYQGLHLFSEAPAAALESGGGRTVSGATYVPGFGGGDSGLTDGRLRAIRPSDVGADPARLEASINKVQATLGSANHETYLGYSDLLDVPSCIDTHILNEFMMNYRSEGLPVNIYMAENRRLSMGPVWNFDEALDNTVAPLAEAAQDASRTLWFPDLFKSLDFVTQYRDRYYRLFRSVLDPKRVGDLIDETVLFLGPALVRDWDRWRGVYTDSRRLEPLTAANGEVLIRATQSLEQEIVKIQYNLREQNQKIRLDLRELRWRPGLIDSSSRVRRNTILAAVFIAAFFTLTSFAKRR